MRYRELWEGMNNGGGDEEWQENCGERKNCGRQKEVCVKPENLGGKWRNTQTYKSAWGKIIPRY